MWLLCTCVILQREGARRRASNSPAHTTGRQTATALPRQDRSVIIFSLTARHVARSLAMMVLVASHCVDVRPSVWATPSFSMSGYPGARPRPTRDWNRDAKVGGHRTQVRCACARPRTSAGWLAPARVCERSAVTFTVFRHARGHL